MHESSQFHAKFISIHEYACCACNSSLHALAAVTVYHVALVANRSKHMTLFDGVSDVREWM
jgi:hypothetical protein